MDYFIPKHIRGRFATPAQKAAAEAAGKEPTAFGTPYEFFRGIHHVPDALADSHDANALGIVPVEEMSDDDWRLLGLNKDAWMAENRARPESADNAPGKIGDGDPVPEAAAASPVSIKAPAGS